jgi:hypothetical protein
MLVVATWRVAIALQRDDVTPSSSAALASAFPEPSASSMQPAPIASATSGGPARTEPVLELVADAPIAKVIVANAQKVSLERGRAFVTVSPWKGDLTIDAELANGAFARGTAHEGGASTVQLTTMKRVAGARPRLKPATSGSAKGELHEDPYKK